MTQTPKEIRDYTCVIADDERPNRRDGTCFFCAERIGAQHKTDCVIRKGAGSFLVAIRKNSTGEVRFYRDDFEWEGYGEFQWTEGNLSCDCNMHASFARAAGPGPEGDENWNSLLGVLPCHGREYTACYAVLPDGRKEPLMEEVQ